MADISRKAVFIAKSAQYPPLV